MIKTYDKLSKIISEILLWITTKRDSFLTITIKCTLKKTSYLYPCKINYHAYPHLVRYNLYHQDISATFFFTVRMFQHIFYKNQRKNFMQEEVLDALKWQIMLARGIKVGSCHGTYIRWKLGSRCACISYRFYSICLRH